MNEVPVHNIHVEPVCAGCLRAAHFLMEAAKVAREDGRSDEQGMHSGENAGWVSEAVTSGKSGKRGTMAPRCATDKRFWMSALRKRLFKGR